jgi:hypothetical protein
MFYLEHLWIGTVFTNTGLEYRWAVAKRWRTSEEKEKAQFFWWALGALIIVVLAIVVILRSL